MRAASIHGLVGKTVGSSRSYLLLEDQHPAQKGSPASAVRINRVRYECGIPGIEGLPLLVEFELVQREWNRRHFLSILGVREDCGVERGSVGGGQIAVGIPDTTCQ